MKKTYSQMDSIPTGFASDRLTPGCVVLEGGAFRGLYSQGVMDFWMQQDLNFACVVGVSAGAMGGAGYAAGQIGRSARVNLGYRHDSNYIGWKALWKAHSPIRLDFPMRDYDEVEPIRMDHLLADGRRFVAVASEVKTGRTKYFEKSNCMDMIEAIKASASMPFISPAVRVNGRKYLDGGCTCKIPYQWAIKEGYRKVVVIRTRERSFRKPDKAGKLARIFYHRNFAFAARLDNSNRSYNRQCRELEELEKAGRIFVIAPSEPVTVKRLDGDMEKLGNLYWLGYHDAEASFLKLQEYLAN